MIEQPKWHFSLPKQLKDILVSFRRKAQVKGCVEQEKVDSLLNSISWINLPTIVDDALELLAVNTGRTDRSLPDWATLPTRIELLKTKVGELDCRSLNPEIEKEEEAQITVEEAVEEVIEEELEEQAAEESEEVLDNGISKIQLVEYDAGEDLTGDNEEVDITVYFEDKSGDEVPNIGKKLFKDKVLTQPLEGYKGAFYFTNSKSEDKVTMLVRSTGTVKRTKFEV